MLQQRYRFHGHGGLRFLHKNGTTARSRYISLRFVANPHRPHSRVAVIVSKKVSKSAVKRNRIRRRVYEIIRVHFAMITPHTDMVFSVHNIAVATIPILELEDMILDMLHQAHLYREVVTSGILGEIV